jgi:hypothetical protein
MKDRGGARRRKGGARNRGTRGRKREKRRSQHGVPSQALFFYEKFWE